MERASLMTTPFDILLPILSYACTDGGQTGCALSLTCKALRNICLETSVDISSAVVCGEYKLKRFLMMLRRRPADMRRVKSLFLYHSASPELALYDVRRLQSGIGSTQLMLLILRTINPQSLQIMSIDYYVEHPEGPLLPLLPVLLPSLRELTICGALKSDAFTHSSPGPALRRLHIKHYDRLPEDLGAQLTRLFPVLTHLRVESGANFGDDSEILSKFVHAYCRREFHASLSTSPSTTTNTTTTTTPDPGRHGFTNYLDLPSTAPATPLPVPPLLRRIYVGFQPIAPWNAHDMLQRTLASSIHSNGLSLDILSGEQHFYGVSSSNDDDDGDNEDGGRRKRTLVIKSFPSAQHDIMALFTMSAFESSGGPKRMTADERRADEVRIVGERFAEARREWAVRADGTGRGNWL
ncbi:hypothetical protein EUX98_g9231 [Antrodiella citrinella]|uniref:F-box domain-containing protein n=1 Tax=Antrodiella citrinella TaxID=2447956 RepID=A0A4S4LWJ9_9APHY|nr:hypothetical protein EUX98_g9231 [Antrodiella citrinella]